MVLHIMQNSDDIINCYNKTARNYADKFIDELSKKHLDRILLNAFASENSGKGKSIDLGCGPGQTTKYLAEQGMDNILGTDVSPEMIRVAKEINPALNFETADMLLLQYPDKTFGSAIAFYSIVHFTYEQVRIAFQEINRILIHKGQFLFSFHIGDDTVHLDNFLDHDVNIDFYFFETTKIKDIIEETGFEIVDVIEREPYKEVEYPSKRSYFWARTRSKEKHG